MTPREIRILELKAQYRVLSDIENCFPKGSTHRAAMYVDNKMTEILDELVKLKRNGSKSKV